MHVHTSYRMGKFLTVENITESGLGKFLTSKKLANANVFI